MALEVVDRGLNTMAPPPILYPPPPEEIPAPSNGTNGHAVEPPAAPSVQVGLKLPNGNVLWDNALFCGNPLATPEQRALLLHALSKTAVELGFDEDEFLSRYGWAKRVGVPAMAWGQIEVVPLISEEPEKNRTENECEGDVDESPLPS